MIIIMIKTCYSYYHDYYCCVCLFVCLHIYICVYIYTHTRSLAPSGAGLAADGSSKKIQCMYLSIYYGCTNLPEAIPTRTE